MEEPTKQPLEASEAVISQPHTKEAIQTKLKVKIISIMAGSFLIFLFGVIVFQPHAYLWLLSKHTRGTQQSTITDVTIDRSITDNTGASTDGSNVYADTIRVATDTSYVSPETWWFTTKVIDPETEQMTDGIEVKIFGQDAFQRQAESDTDFTSYTFQEGEYDSTIQAIESSSFFQEGILEYAHNPRFVWNPEGKSWWLAHYQFQVDVAQLEQEKPEWYSPELYPFGVEPNLGDQDIVFVADIWMNPFTGKVVAEEWNIFKENEKGATSYDVTLDITMMRSFAYPADLSIERPS